MGEADIPQQCQAGARPLGSPHPTCSSVHGGSLGMAVPLLFEHSPSETDVLTWSDCIPRSCGCLATCEARVLGALCRLFMAYSIKPISSVPGWHRARQKSMRICWSLGSSPTETTKLVSKLLCELHFGKKKTTLKNVFILNCLFTKVDFDHQAKESSYGSVL